MAEQTSEGVGLAVGGLAGRVVFGGDAAGCVLRSRNAFHMGRRAAWVALAPTGRKVRRNHVAVLREIIDGVPWLFAPDSLEVVHLRHRP